MSVKKASSRSRADIARGERAARQVYAELGIAHPLEAPLEDLAFIRGALVRDVPMKGAQGRLTRVGSSAIIAVSTSVRFPTRRRWTIAHELGHLELHKDGNQLELCSEEVLAEQSVSEIYDAGTEQEANAFASEFLMPASLWSKRVDVRQPTLDIVSGLANEFQVSLVAAAIRFTKLCPERCCVVFAKRGKVEWFSRSVDFRHWISPGASLDPYTLAYDYFAKSRVPPKRPEAVSASAWLTGPSVGKDDDLVEHCWLIPSLEATLSLLWISTNAEY